MLKKNLRIPLQILAILLALFVVVEVLAYGTYVLAGAGDTDLAALNAIEPPVRRPLKAKAIHQVSEWPQDKGRDFDQAPAFDAMVKAGELSPVDQRLPQDPLVIEPPDQYGPYGGTWMRYGTGPSDIGVFGARLAYDGLVRWGPMAQEIRPNLASSWDIEDGGRSFTFHLRRGVRWSDGHPFTADDILFWYEDVLQEPDLTPVIPIEYRHGGELMRLEKLDDYTIRFVFAEPYGLFLKLMASNFSYQMVETPAHYLKKYHRRYVEADKLKRLSLQHGQDFWYQLFKDRREWRNPDIPRLWAWVCTEPPPARPAVFERNPYYWKVDTEGRQLPYIDRITFDIYDIETINLKAINGEIGMQGRHINFPNYPLFMANRKQGGYRVLHWIDGGDGMVAITPNLNHRDPVLRQIFNDRRFRIALSHAMDRDAINKANYFGIGEPRQIAPPAVSRYYVPEYEKAYIEYDPDRANALLDEMGLNQRDEYGVRLRPDGEPLVIHIETSSTQSSASRLFEMTAGYWTAIGVKTKVKTTARQLYSQRRNALLCDVHVWGGAGEIIPVLDPRWFMPYSASSFQGLDYARWYRTGGKKGTEPPEPMLRCLDLFGQISRTIDEEEQIRLFKEIIEINRQHLWVIGTVGEIPPLYIVKDTFRNVPEVAVGCWPLRTPGATAPECYAIDEGGG
jgi:peptide/nickel transport system substrate-binding protein